MDGDASSPVDKLVIRVRQGAGAEKLARRIKTLAPSLRCAACGNRDFALLEEPSQLRRSVFVRTEGAPEPGAKNDRWEPPPSGAEVAGRRILHAVATLVCTRCGYVEQFSDGVLIFEASPDDWGIDVDAHDTR